MPSATIDKPRDLEVTALSPDQFGLWDALVDRSAYGTVFHKTWWLKATGYEFEILGCWNKDGQLAAGIPLPRKHKKGLILFHAPPLTPYLGPVFDFPTEEFAREKVSAMRSLGESLARAIVGFDCFSQIAGAVAPDFQGFLWAGFHVEVGYTFRFDRGTSVREALQAASRTHRQKLKPDRNEDIFIEDGYNVDALLEVNCATFARQGRSAPYSGSMVRSLVHAAQERQSGGIYVARGRGGKPLSAVFVVHDSRASYQIVSGVNWDEHNSSAGYMTTWRAIQSALDSGLAFDFEGSRIRGVERYYRRWGAPAKPVWILKKAGSLRGRLATMFLNGRDGTN